MSPSRGGLEQRATDHLDSRRVPGSGVALLRALRPHQWTKNLLVFVPLLLAHVLTLPASLAAAYTFIAMCLASSGAYVFNDLLDVEADRQHPFKRDRPIASGVISVTMGTVLAGVLIVAAIAVALVVSGTVAVMVGGYIALTLIYSIWLKKVIAIDVVLLTTLYCLRVQIGGSATGIAISPWTLTFSMFIFLSLALMKRYAELHNMRSVDRETVNRRGYRREDLPIIANLGSASALTSVLVIALYVNGEDVRRLYAHPNFLWLICLVVVLWLMRLWLLANRGSMHEDPVLFAIKDSWSLLSAAAAGAVILLAI